MKDDWSLKDEKFHYFYRKEDIDVLREKLIEDFIEFIGVENTNKIIDRINKRFGVEE